MQDYAWKVYVAVEIAQRIGRVIELFKPDSTTRDRQSETRY